MMNKPTRNLLGIVDLTGLKVVKIDFIASKNAFHIELSNGDIYEEKFSAKIKLTSRDIERYIEMTTRFPAAHLNIHSKIN